MEREMDFQMVTKVAESNTHISTFSRYVHRTDSFNKNTVFFHFGWSSLFHSWFWGPFFVDKNEKWSDASLKRNLSYFISPRYHPHASDSGVECEGDPTDSGALRVLGPTGPDIWMLACASGNACFDTKNMLENTRENTSNLQDLICLLLSTCIHWNHLKSILLPFFNHVAGELHPPCLEIIFITSIHCDNPIGLAIYHYWVPRKQDSIAGSLRPENVFHAVASSWHWHLGSHWQCAKCQVALQIRLLSSNCRLPTSKALQLRSPSISAFCLRYR